MKNLLIKSSLLILVFGLGCRHSPWPPTPVPTCFHQVRRLPRQDGSGNTPMGKNLKLRDLGSADVQKQSDKELKDIVTKGKPPKMPAYTGKLTDAQIDDLVKFIRTLKK